MICPTREVRKESVVSLCSERFYASTGCPWLSGPKWFDRLFLPAIVDSQIARLDRAKIFERMVCCSSPLLSGLCYFFYFQIDDLEKF